MIEKVFKFSESQEKMIEKIVSDDNVILNHMILPQGESLPEHYSNSNVYMIVVGGVISLQLADQHRQEYSKGSIINVPFNTKMNVSNQQQGIAEIFVIKAPHPREMQT